MKNYNIEITKEIFDKITQEEKVYKYYENELYTKTLYIISEQKVYSIDNYITGTNYYITDINA